MRTFATSNGTSGVSFGCFGTLLLLPFIAVYSLFAAVFYLFRFFYEGLRR